MRIIAKNKRSFFQRRNSHVFTLLRIEISYKVKKKVLPQILSAARLLLIFNHVIVYTAAHIVCAYDSPIRMIPADQSVF